MSADTRVQAPGDVHRPALIFDFDGTLADTFDTITRILNTYCQEYGIPRLGPEEIEELRGMTSAEIIRKFKIPLHRIPKIVRRTQRELGLRMHEVSLFPGIRDLILNLKRAGYMIGVLTSNSRDNVLSLLRAQNMDIFDFIHSESNLFGKGRALNHLLKDQHLERESVVYVGDELRDIEACRKAQVPVVAVSWGFHNRETLNSANPMAVVDSPAEIEPLVRGWLEEAAVVA